MKKLFIVFGNVASFLAHVDYDLRKQSGGARGEVIECTSSALMSGCADGALMSTSCQRIFSLGFQQVPQCPLRHCQSLQPISHSLNVCQAKLQIVPPRSILVHSRSQSSAWSICAVFCQISSRPLQEILQRWMFYILIDFSKSPET